MYEIPEMIKAPLLCTVLSYEFPLLPNNLFNNYPAPTGKKFVSNDDKNNTTKLPHETFYYVIPTQAIS